MRLFPMKARVCLAVSAALILSACGGGGTAPGPGQQGDPGDLTSRQAITQILTACGQAGIEELNELFLTLEPMLSPGALGAAPGFTITGFDLLNAMLDWSLDVEEDGSIDATGSFGFRTPADTPYIPPNLSTIIPGLGGDPANLPDVIASLPDGTILRISYIATKTFTTTGAIDTVFENFDGSSALPVSSSGTALVDQGDCDSNFSWADIGMNDLLGSYPNATFDMVITTQADAITGNIVMEGTADAVINTTLQSNGAEQQFGYNLDTGVLTPVN